MVVRTLTMLIELYRRCISPSFPPSCRFEPSCSVYAKRALGKHGLWRGGYLASKRLLRCHPWNQGGFDPVP